MKVIGIYSETPDVKTFRLAPFEGGDLPFDHIPGQYMNLHLNIDGQLKNRCYTIASPPTRRGYCELSIKREQRGTVSRHLHDHIQVGDTLNVSCPAGRFTFNGSNEKQVLLIAGGVGITPIMSMARYLTDLAWTGEIYFVFVAKTEEDIIFRRELESLAARHRNFHLCITLSRLNEKERWAGECGRITGALLRRHVSNLESTPVYLCGPDSMMQATRELLIREGVSADRIHTEAFESPGLSQESVADEERLKRVSPLETLAPAGADLTPSKRLSPSR